MPIRRYPDQMLEFKVPLQQARALRSMDQEKLCNLPLHAFAAAEATEQVDLFFNDVGASVIDEEAFLKVLGCVSGLLTKEFERLRGILMSCNFPVSELVVKRMQERFGSGRAVSNVRLSLLTQLIVPKRPRIPEENAGWGWEEWVNWVSDEYTPYRYWQQASGHYDADLESAVGRFTDWYLSAYESIHASVERSNVHSLSALTCQILQDELSIIFVVDCLPKMFVDQFSQAFMTAGFHPHDSRLVGTLLPSHTEVCKPRLISGDWDAKATAYEKAIQRRGEQSWPGKDVRYFGGDLNGLRNSARPIKPAVLVLNYLLGDETLHANVVQDGSTYEEELHRIYARLADAAREVFDRSAIDAERFGIYILTDHGATRILAEETATLDGAVVKKLFPTEKHRFAAIEDSEGDAIPDKLWDFGYRFKPPFEQSDLTYFIPRGHNTIRAGIPKGYVHGGATPEEVIVPVMTWRPVSVPWKAPSVRFAGLTIDGASGRPVFYVKRMITLTLEIQNQNAKPIDVARIDILEPHADVRRATAARLAPGQTSIVELECSFDASALKADELAVQITFTIDGARQFTDCRAAVLFKSAMTGGFSLRDL